MVAGNLEQNEAHSTIAEGKLTHGKGGFFFLSTHILQHLKRPICRYRSQRSSQEKQSLKLLHLYCMQMIATVFYIFFWKIPYFTVFRVCLHDGRVLDLVVKLVNLSWHYHSYYSHTYLYHSC